GSGISELIGALVGLVSESRAREPEATRTTIHRPVSGEIQLRRHDDGSWEVMGRAAQRAVALSDLTDDQALAYATERLQQLGVNTALARAGLRSGDEVRIGDFSFEYEEDS
ncbi:MAG: Obg family GTPase CgtA, partial [Acidimicrobiaceae bacterium]|nr:Obg family GTPase CgtA [Acidimicrobiaceae bacterium]